MTTELDHLVHAVPDLTVAVEEFAEQTGVRPVMGGAHPGRGTHNALVGLSWQGSSRCYLELLAPDPAQPDVPDEDLMLDLAAVRDRLPLLHTWAVRPRDLAATVAEAQRSDVEVGSAVAASRDLPDGGTLAWELAVPRPLGLGGVQPFLIAWTGGTHPTGAGLPSVELTSLTLTHPRPHQVERVLDVLGFPRALVQVTSGPSPMIQATLATAQGQLVLS